MTIEITTRDGNQGYVQVRANGTETLCSISATQARRVLRELHAPIGDDLLSGRYVAMHMDGEEQVPNEMERSRYGGITFRSHTAHERAVSSAARALGSMTGKKKKASSAVNGLKGGKPKHLRGGRPRKAHD